MSALEWVVRAVVVGGAGYFLWSCWRLKREIDRLAELMAAAKTREAVYGKGKAFTPGPPLEPHGSYRGPGR